MSANSKSGIKYEVRNFLSILNFSLFTTSLILLYIFESKKVFITAALMSCGVFLMSLYFYHVKIKKYRRLEE